MTDLDSSIFSCDLNPVDMHGVFDKNGCRHHHTYQQLFLIGDERDSDRGMDSTVLGIQLKSGSQFITA